MTQERTLYFAHPACIDTRAEGRAIDYLSKLYPNHRIVHPLWDAAPKTARANTALAEAADMVVHLPFGDGRIDAAIGADLQRLLMRNREVHELHVNVEGVPIGMVSHITRLDPERILTPEQSALRTMPNAAARAFRR